MNTFGGGANFHSRTHARNPTAREHDDLLQRIIFAQWIVMKKSEPLDSGGYGIVHDALNGTVPPTKLGGIFRLSVLRVVNNEVSSG